MNNFAVGPSPGVSWKYDADQAALKGREREAELKAERYVEGRPQHQAGLVTAVRRTLRRMRARS